MTVADLRIELLRLTYTHGRDASEAVDRAKVLEQYVSDGAVLTPDSESDEPKRRRGRPRITERREPRGPEDSGKDCT
jgi:hypothetical protein